MIPTRTPDKLHANLVVEHRSMDELVAHSVGSTNVVDVIVEFVNQ